MLGNIRDKLPNGSCPVGYASWPNITSFPCTITTATPPLKAVSGGNKTVYKKMDWHVVCQICFLCALLDSVSLDTLHFDVEDDGSA